MPALKVSADSLSFLALVVGFLAVRLSCVAEARIVKAMTYLGCYGDTNADRDLNGLAGLSQLASYSGIQTYNAASNTTMTPRLCSQICSLGGFRYFGVQHSSYCFCGNTFGRYGPASNQATDCDSPCSGDSSVKCGGFHKNSVYSIDYQADVGCPKFASQRSPFPAIQTTSGDLSSIYWTQPEDNAISCLLSCQSNATCQAYLYSSSSRTCHQLRYTALPTVLQSTTDQVFFRA